MSIRRLARKLTTTVYLWHADGTGLQVQSEMHDIIDWVEVGSLRFSRVIGTVSGVSESGVCESVVSEINLPNEFGAGLKASKLVLSTHGIAIESGVVIEGAGGNEIILVAGASPYTIARPHRGRTLNLDFSLTVFWFDLTSQGLAVGGIGRVRPIIRQRYEE